MRERNLRFIENNGKSLCFQLPCAADEKGITVVVTPLIALMENQVTHARSFKIPTETINSTLNAADRKRVRGDLMSLSPKTKLLYVTPEQVATTGFLEICRALNKLKLLKRFVVDEAHCVLEWGHDFRPDYLKLSKAREEYPHIPWAALTATASKRDEEKIISSLKLQNVVTIRTSSFRKNLFYDVYYKDTMRGEEFQHLKDFIIEALGPCWQDEEPQMRGCGIVYCRTRQDCYDVAVELQKFGLASSAYHAGMKAAERTEAQDGWMNGKYCVIAATISFGMGIDKSTVRFIAHWSPSKSLKSFYQESGRAGRDGKPAKCRMYYSLKDRKAITFLIGIEASRSKSQRKKEHASFMMKEFENVVSMFESATCRHSNLCKEFGEKLKSCGSCCDVCTRPKEVDKKLSTFRSQELRTAVYKFSESDYDDVYEGGRRYMSEFGGDGRGGGDEGVRERMEKEAKRELEQTILKQFQLRRGVKQDNEALRYDKHGKQKQEREREIPHNSVILEPRCCAIPEVSIEARQSYAVKLRQDLWSNYTTYIKAIDEQIRNSVQGGPQEKLMMERTFVEQIACQLELEAFKTKKNIYMYKRQMATIYKNVKDATSNRALFDDLIARHSLDLKMKEKQPSKKTLFDLFQDAAKKMKSDKKSVEVIPIVDSSGDADGPTSSALMGCSPAHDEAAAAAAREVVVFSDPEARVAECSSAGANDECGTSGDNPKTASPTPACSLPQADDQKVIVTQNELPVSDTLSARKSTSKPVIKYFFEVNTENKNVCSKEAGNQSAANTYSEKCPKMDFKTGSQLLQEQRNRIDSQIEEIVSRPKRLASCEESSSAKRRSVDSERTKKDRCKAISFVNDLLYPEFKRGAISKEDFKIICKEVSDHAVDSGILDKTTIKKEIDKKLKKLKYL
ncbi:ATP-dependent DNA helicase Q5-like isoform X2 [Varroa jacobsoni]|uniref:ATP-dependent DNA helicase Q5-like isoform X2 n=1 Tax=Varroa jacobsoni TaxID=62625 RepID=UPI000BF4EC49|nr:ATP-dependent DNA helicase Q5-like isoform X2 [Varroa jacobsoni]